MKKILFIGTFLLFNYGAFAQLDSSITSIDTSKIVAKSEITKTTKTDKKPYFAFLKEEGYSPKKAAFYSAIVPGGGQIYNKQYWKAPIALAAVGGAGYSVYFNTTEYRRYRNAYRLRVDGDPTTLDEFHDNPNATETALITARDKHRKWMEQSYIAVVVVHGLQVLEAYTSAHLKNFDIDDDLSLHWQPTVKMQNTPILMTSNMTFGVSMQLVNKTPNLILDF
ncbi:MAG: hypothetical protein HC803_07450 [Saprospiraceae bacterium]|nr:hypothetical protein [Saprospiraceae bacterium]